MPTGEKALRAEEKDNNSASSEASDNEEHYNSVLEEDEDISSESSQTTELSRGVSTSKEKDSANNELSRQNLASLKQKIEDSCVVYMSRIPPRMKPKKLKKILQHQYKLNVGRVFFSEEDPQLRIKRKIAGGSRRKFFTEGWIEFFDKKKIKSWVKSANNSKIENKTHSYFNEDLWNIKYLPKFKWNNLTERIAYETQARSQILQNEISQAKKFNQSFIDKVELNKQVSSMENKRKLKTASENPSSTNDTTEGKVKVLRSFRQREVQVKDLTTKKQLENKFINTQTNPKNNKNKVKNNDKSKEDKLNNVLNNLFG